MDPLKGIVSIGCMWIYKRKIEPNRKVKNFKLRLVAKRYRQHQGVDYKDTFLPVTVVKSIWEMPAVVAHYDYEIWYKDVKMTFLNSYLEEDIFIKQS